MPAPQKFFDSFFKMATIAEEEEEEEEEMDIDEAKDVHTSLNNKNSSNNNPSMKRTMPMSTLGDIIGYEPPQKRRRLF